MICTSLDTHFSLFIRSEVLSCHIVSLGQGCINRAIDLLWLSGLFSDELFNDEAKRVANDLWTTTMGSCVFDSLTDSWQHSLTWVCKCSWQGACGCGLCGVEELDIGRVSEGLVPSVYRLWLLKDTPFVFIFLVFINQKPIWLRIVHLHLVLIKSEKFVLSDKEFKVYNLK